MQLELPFTENTIEEISLVLDMLSLGYLLDFQVGNARVTVRYTDLEFKGDLG